jgi:hypothetical protein
MSFASVVCPYCDRSVVSLVSVVLSVGSIEHLSGYCCRECYPIVLREHSEYVGPTGAKSFVIVRVDESTIRAICTDTEDGVFRD